MSQLSTVEYLSVHSTCTSDCQFSRTLCSPHGVLRHHLILPGVLGADPEYEHGAHSVGVGDVIIGVGIQTDIVAQPCHVRRGVSFYSAAHVALVALRSRVQFEWHQELWRTLQVTALGFRHLDSELF